MSKKCVYDTRFFIEFFYSSDGALLKKLKEDLKTVKDRLVSTVTIHEIHRINFEREGREVASLRSEAIHRDFKVIDVDYETAIKSAELRSRYKIPMADSIIAAIAKIYDCPVMSDDRHFQEVKGLKTKWITTL
jgi:predicted nucleic acid-binding protein